MEKLGTRLEEAVALEAAKLRVNRVKADAFFRAHPRWARVAGRNSPVLPGSLALRIAQYLFWAVAMLIAGSTKWPLGLVIICPILLVIRVWETGLQIPGAPLPIRSGGIDEVGGYMAAYFSWLLGISTILMGIVAFGQPNKDDTRFTFLIAAWALYSILTSLRFRWAAKAARQLALRSRTALDALIKGDVVEIRYETH